MFEKLKELRIKHFIEKEFENIEEVYVKINGKRLLVYVKSMYGTTVDKLGIYIKLTKRFNLDGYNIWIDEIYD